MFRLPRLLLRLLIVLALAFIAYAVWRWGFWGTLAAPVLVTVAGAGEVMRKAGAKSVKKNKAGKPRRVGTSAVSPKPEEGKKRARPRQNNWR